MVSNETTFMKIKKEKEIGAAFLLTSQVKCEALCDWEMHFSVSNRWKGAVDCWDCCQERVCKIKGEGLLPAMFWALEQYIYIRTVTTPSIPEIIWVKNVRAIVVCGFLMKFWKKNISWKFEKKLWVPFGSYLLNSTANPAHFHSNWAESAVLSSR